MKRSAVLGLACLLAACGGPPGRVEFQVRAGATINPSPDGEAKPAAVRLYFLSSTTHMRNADYFELIDHERTVLDSDLLLRRDVMIVPGATQAVRVDRPKEATDVAVVVGFRDLDRATWLAIRKIPSNGRIPVMVDGREVTLPDRFPKPAS